MSCFPIILEAIHVFHPRMLEGLPMNTTMGVRG